MLDIQDETPVIANVRFLAAITRDDFASDYANFILISQDRSVPVDLSRWLPPYLHGFYLETIGVEPIDGRCFRGRLA